MTEPRIVSAAEARKSALMVGAVFLAIAAWNVYKARPTVYAITGGLGGLLVVVGLVSTAGARAFHTGWMRLAVVLGWVNSRILLSAVFYGLLTPVGLIGRLFRRDSLDRRGPKRDSYWVKREKTRQATTQFERQF